MRIYKNPDGTAELVQTIHAAYWRYHRIREHRSEYREQFDGFEIVENGGTWLMNEEGDQYNGYTIAKTFDTLAEAIAYKLRFDD